MWASLGLNTETLKKGLKKYGRTGLVTYLGLSTLVTTGVRAICGPCRPPSYHQTKTPAAAGCHHHAGFYVAIERKVDVKKLVGIKGGFVWPRSTATRAASLQFQRARESLHIQSCRVHTESGGSIYARLHQSLHQASFSMSLHQSTFNAPVVLYHFSRASRPALLSSLAHTAFADQPCSSVPPIKPPIAD